MLRAGALGYFVKNRICAPRDDESASFPGARLSWRCRGFSLFGADTSRAVLRAGVLRELVKNPICALHDDEECKLSRRAHLAALAQHLLSGAT